MKKILFLLIFICTSQFGFSQTNPTTIQTRKPNSIYLELGGNSLHYSLNYDRVIPFSNVIKLALGGGVTYFNPMSSFCVSPAANFLFGQNSHHFETGICAFIPFTADKIVLPAARIGYRYQPVNGGFLFRIGFTPFMMSGGVLPWGGISLGYTF